MRFTTDDWLRILASSCELLGVFFLSVEAIKLEKFRRLRDRIFKPITDYLNPTIQLVDAKNDTPKRRRKRAQARSLLPFNLYLIGFFILGCLVLWMALLILKVSPLEAIKELFSSSAWYYFLVPFVIWLCIMVGVLVYSLFAEVVLAGFVSMLNAIDGNTPTGTIGIIGFLLYLVAIVIRTFIELRPSR